MNVEVPAAPFRESPTPLESVLCTEELYRRPPRSPDHETENRVLVVLAQSLADSPGTILQMLVESFLELIPCDSAGLSLLTADGNRFRRAAIAGTWRPHLDSEVPRDCSPCGDALAQDAPLLFRHWERRYPNLLEAAPAAVEGLVVPFHIRGRAVGTIWAVTHTENRKFDAEDLRLLQNLGRFAAAACQAVESADHHQKHLAAVNRMEDAVQSSQALEKLNAELGEGEKRLAKELASTRQLQAVSALLIEGGNTDVLYQKIVDAAAAILNSDCASLQILHPERGHGGELRLLAFRGFDAAAARYWNWVSAESQSICAIALRNGGRYIAANVEQCDFMAGTDDQATLLRSGIRSVQSTPLVSRDGRFLGMLSTHWREMTVPTESDLRQFDILARQAADLIERRQADEALRQGEERYRSLMQAITSVVWTTGPEGGIVTPQPSWSGFTGQTWDEYRDFGWLNAIHPDDRERVQTLWRAACAARSNYRSDGRMWHAASGSYRHFEARGVPVLNSDGTVREWVGKYLDVEDRKQAEASVRVSEVRYRRLFESAKDGILILDTYAGTITDANPFICELLGYSRAELLGKELWEIGLFSDQEASTAAIRELQRSQYLRPDDLSLETKDGHRIDVELVSNVYTEGEVSVVQCNIRDISGRKRAEAALRESQARLRFTLDSARVGDWDLDLTTDVARRSLRHDQAFGYNEPVPKWGFAEFLRHVHPDDRAAVERRFREAVATLQDWHFEGRVIWPDGSVHWIGAHGSIFRTADGKPTHMLGIVADITEQKRLEEGLRQYAADLSESDRRKNEFLAMLAHELRNPLAPIRNAAIFLRQAEGTSEAVRKAAALMERQVGQMVRLVDDLLDVSRINRGKIELRRGRVELASAISHAVEANRPLSEKLGHELTITVPPEPIYLNADPTRLSQVVGNLLNNACKFTDRGGRISLTVEREHEWVAIRVQDNGIGIAADQLSRIFEMFTQIDTSLERSVSGLGIGLTLVKSLVEMHGGTVDVTSEGLGRGSEFVVRLPTLIETNTEPPTETTFGMESSAIPRRILVVDDNQDSANSLADLLTIRGHTTHTAYDGLEAVKAAAAFRPEVVLLDIGLPKLNGYDAARTMRKEPWGKDVLLVALTGWGQEEDRQKSREAGFDNHLVKPVDHNALSKLLARHREESKLLSSPGLAAPDDRAGAAG